MSLRTFAEFTSDLPTGQIESETDFVQLGGKPVAEVLRDMVARLGCDAQPVECAGDHGWDFRFRFRKLRLGCQITLLDGYLAIFKDFSKWRIFTSDHPDFAALITRLGEELAADPRFHDVGWFHPHEVLSGVAGASGPAAEFRDVPCVRRQAVESAADLSG